MEKYSKPKKALMIGATGATGRELVELLLKSKDWGKVTVFVRRTIERWENFTDEEKQKFNIITIKDLEELGDIEKMKNLLNGELDYDAFFCMLGSTTTSDDFDKVNYDYPLLGATLCEKLSIPHFSLISSAGADHTSFFKVLKVFGKRDKECSEKSILHVTVFRPGFITDRDDPRVSEKIMKFVPFFPKVNVKELASAMMNDALNLQSNKETYKKIYDNKEILKIKINS